MGDIINGVSSEYELPREPRLYESKLPMTGCNIPMPNVKQNGNRVCSDCIKNDICPLQDELAKAMSDVCDINERTNVFIDVIVKCKKFVQDNTYTGVR